MEIRIIKTFKNTSQLKGLIVAIDVLRAFTTVCYLFKNKVKLIIPVGTIESALNLKKENPGYILIGERQGLKPTGFDFNNSPAEIKNINFLNKTVIITTTAGTQVINDLKQKSSEIITASFVNIGAVVKYIKDSGARIVSLICTNNRFPDNEDYLCAEYIKDSLEDRQPDFLLIKNYLTNSPSSDGFLKNPLTKFSQEDFNLCLELNRFDFVIKVKRSKNNLYFEKV